MTDEVISQYYSDCVDLLDHLNDSGNMALHVHATTLVQKHFILCVASRFEKQLCQAVQDYAQTVSGDHCLLAEFVKNKAIERQYHSWFDWKECKNANTFFGLFGADFRNHMKEKVNHDSDLAHSIKNFLMIGKRRNQLVHEDLMNASIDVTLKEAYEEYLDARRFVDLFPDVLFEFANNP